jgi:hypothetical protein
VCPITLTTTDNLGFKDIVPGENKDRRFLLTQKYLVYSLPLLAIIGISILLILRQYDFAILGSYLAVPLLLAPILFLKIRRAPLEDITSKYNYFTILLTIYSIFYLISILILYFYEVRLLVYYVVITIITTITLLEIILVSISKKKSFIILSQIILIFLNILFGVTLKYFYFVSRTDPISHVWLIENLINQGKITETFGIYKSFPLWHILVSSIYHISDPPLPVHKLMFLTNGIIYAFLVIVIYLISLKIFKNERIALISSFLYVFFPDIQDYGMGSLPRNVVSILFVFLFIIYDNSVPRKILAIILNFSLVIYHTASMPFIIIILSLIYLLQKIYLVATDKKFLNLNYLLLLIVTTISYWIYGAPDLIIWLFRNISAPSHTEMATKSFLNTPLNELFNYLQYMPIFFLLIIGVLISLESKKLLNYKRIFLMVGLILSSLSFPGPGLIINKLAQNFAIERFGEYSFLFIVLAVSYGFFELFCRSKKYKTLIVLLFIIMTFLSITNDFIASDNPLVKRPFYTFYITEGEVDASYHVAKITKGYTMSDYVVTRFLDQSLYKNKSHLLEVNSKNMKFLINTTNDTILIRKSELYKRPLNIYSSEDDFFELYPNWKKLKYYYLDSPLWGALRKYNKIYESGQAAAYSLFSVQVVSN